MNGTLFAENNPERSNSSMCEMGSDDLCSYSSTSINMSSAIILPVSVYSTNIFGTPIDNQQYNNWSLASDHSELSPHNYSQTIFGTSTSENFHSSPFLDLGIGKVVTIFEDSNVKSQQQSKQSNESAQAQASCDANLIEVNRTSHGSMAKYGTLSSSSVNIDRAIDIGNSRETTECSTTSLLSKKLTPTHTSNFSEDTTNFQDEPTLNERASENTYDQYDNNLDQEQVSDIVIQYEDDLSDIMVPYETSHHLASIFDSFMENFDDSEEQYLLIDSESLYNTLISDSTSFQLDASQLSSTQDKNIQPKTYIEPPSLSITVVCKKGSCDNSNMFVRTSDQGVKKLCCPYCLKTFSKLARHMEIAHKDEADVRKFRSLPKGSKQRRSYQDALRKAGSLKWNTNADLNKGELIPSRRPNKKLGKKASGYTTCPYCMGSHTKTNLRHHAATCIWNPVKGERMLMTLGRAAEGRLDEQASDYLAQVMSPMRDDEIVRLIRYDWILIVYGNKLCCKYSPHYQQKMIRARLRLTGRLLYEIKKINPTVTDFAAIYNTDNYRAMVSAIKTVGRFDPTTNEFGAPATASNSVTIIKVIGKYLAAEYIFKHDRESKLVTEEFLTYMESDISISILKLVSETQSRMRREKKENIPLLEDVKKLLMYINTERNKFYSQLKEISEITSEETYSPENYKRFAENYKRLAELTSAWIVVFNRRRVGEVQNILVNEFTGRQSIDEDSNENLMSKLSPESQQVAKKFKRMKIRGKKGRTVPVLLKPVIDKAIELLLTHREKARIPPSNKCLFALPSSTETNIKVVDAYTALVDCSKKCGASNPLSLRGTNLRKHMATMCVSMELTDALISEVAKFMGHDEKIHREYYRHNPIDREIVQMSQLLEAAVGKCDENMGDESDDGENFNDDNCTALEASVDADDCMVDADDCMVDDEPQTSAAKKRKKSASKDDNTEAHTSKLKFTKKRWSKDEIEAVYAAFPQNFIRKSLPTPQEIEEQQDKYSALRQRTWQQIKTWINNQNKKLK